MRRIFLVTLAATCLFASAAVDAQRHSAPAYHPPPPPPPAPRYTPPPPPAHQNVRPGSQAGGSTYHGGQTHSGATGGNLGGYRPGSISNSTSQSSGRLSGGAGTSSQHSAQTGVKGTTKSAGSGTTKQAGATGFGKAPAHDKGMAAGKGGTKVAAASAGAGLFAAGTQHGHAAPSKSAVDDPFRPDLKHKAKNDFNKVSEKKLAEKKDDGKKKQRGPQDCKPGEKWDPVLQMCVPIGPTLQPG